MSVVYTFFDAIETLFVKQKKGIRGVIPGFINYKYKDGKIPGHTKNTSPNTKS